MHVCSIYKRDIMRYHTYRCVHYVALLYILLYIYKKYICIHYIHIMRLLIVTVVCEYIPRLGSPYRFTTSEMRSLCSCNGSKGSCGIAQQEGFLPVSMTCSSRRSSTSRWASLTEALVLLDAVKNKTVQVGMIWQFLNWGRSIMLLESPYCEDLILMLTVFVAF